MKFKFLAKGLVWSSTLCAGLLPPVASAQQFWSMGFLESAQETSSLSIVNWAALTHVDDFGTAPNANGTLTCDFGSESCTSSAFTGPRATLISTAHSHGAKVLMCVSDGASGSAFASATSSGTLNTFVANIMALVNANGYDGVDIDWESNIASSSSQAQMTTFLAALRSALGSSKLLTADAVTSDYAYWAKHYSSLDKVNFMVYDLEGNWNPYSWFNSALYSDSNNEVWSIDLIKQRALAAGIPAAKLMISIPFYGYVSTGGGVNGPRQSVGGNPSLAQTTYASLVQSYSSQMAGATVDSVAEVPWFAISDGWVEYDNPTSIKAKVNYIKNNGLGGAGYFSLNKDASGQPLAAAVAAALGTSSDSETAPSITSTSPLTSGTVSTAYSLAVSASGTTPMTWSITSGSLPSGLSLNGSNGNITGTPTKAGSSSFTVQASNAMGNSSKQFSMTVAAQSTVASWYKLVSKNSGMCLDVTGMSTAAGVQLEQWPCTGMTNQSFQLTAVTGGYKITNQNSGLSLNVSGDSSANGAPIVQWGYSGATNEIWKLIQNSDGSYSLAAVNSGSCIDVSGVSTTEGAKIQQWQCSGGANQKWTLVATQ